MDTAAFIKSESERMTRILADRRSRLVAKGREWLKAEATDIKGRIAYQMASATRYEGGGTVACLQSRLDDLRAAWVLA